MEGKQERNGALRGVEVEPESGVELASDFDFKFGG